MPDDPTLQLAFQHLHAGRFPAAEAAFRAHLSIAPNHPLALLGLAQSLHFGGRTGEALAVYEAAIAASPNDPVAWSSLGRLHHQAQRFERAIDAYERALSLEPTNPVALAGIPVILERENRLDEARAAAHRCLAAIPGQPAALLTLAKVDRRQSRFEDARDTLTRLLTIPDLDARTMARVHIELGHTLDRLGEYDAAFESYAAGKSLWACLPEVSRFPLEAYPARIARYRTMAESEPFDRWPEAPADPEPDPIFFVGFPRSGTTLTERILEAHPNLVGSDEAQLLAPVIQRAAELLKDRGGYPDRLADLSDSQVLELRGVYRGAAERLLGSDRVSGRRLIDKLPLNIVDLPIVRRVFPRSKVIVALRDPRDCCLSCFFQPFDPNAAMVHFASLESAARLYAQVMSLWLLYRDRLGLAWIESRYEDLTADPQAAARRLLEFLGEPWDPGVLSFHERPAPRALSTPSYQAVAEPVHTRASGRWRRYARHIEPIVPILRPFLGAFGYDE